MAVNPINIPDKKDNLTFGAKIHKNALLYCIAVIGQEKGLELKKKRSEKDGNVILSPPISLCQLSIIFLFPLYLFSLSLLSYPSPYIFSHSSPPLFLLPLQVSTQMWSFFYEGLAILQGLQLAYSSPTNKETCLW